METALQGGRAAACQNVRTEVVKLLNLVDWAREQGIEIGIKETLVIDVNGKSKPPVEFDKALVALLETNEPESRSRKAPEAFGDSNVFMRAGCGWLIQFQGKVISEPDGSGPQFTFELINRRTEVWIPCGEVRRPHERSSNEPMSEARARTEGALEEQLVQDGLIVTSGTVKEVSSIASCRALRKEISERSKELEAAGAEGKAIQRRELEALILKLKGRLRVEQHEKVTGPAELDRKAVLKALLAWFKHLRGVHPALAEHLKKSITKGYECAYRPSDGEITWRLSAGTMPSVKEHAPSGGAE